MAAAAGTLFTSRSPIGRILVLVVLVIAIAASILAAANVPPTQTPTTKTWERAGIGTVVVTLAAREAGCFVEASLTSKSVPEIRHEELLKNVPCDNRAVRDAIMELFLKTFREMKTNAQYSWVYIFLIDILMGLP